MGFFPPWRLLLMCKSKNFASFSLSREYTVLWSPFLLLIPPPLLSLTALCSALPFSQSSSLECTAFLLFFLFHENPWLFSSFHCICRTKMYSTLLYVLFLYPINPLPLMPLSHLKKQYCEWRVRVFSEIKHMQSQSSHTFLCLFRPQKKSTIKYILRKKSTSTTKYLLRLYLFYCIDLFS